MSKKLTLPLLLTFLALLAVFGAAAAQDPAVLNLRLSKDMGFASGGKLQGTFSLIADSPETLSRVVFYLDGQSLGEDTSAPFRLQFNTSSFPLGIHTLSAVGYTAGGTELKSKPLQGQFVSSEEGWQTSMKILVPLLAVVVLAMVISFVFTAGSTKKLASLPLGTPRNYGASGGAICPRCHRPFPMHALSLNLGLFSKLEHCPYCGKWGLMRRRSPQELRAAEEAELHEAQVNGAAAAPVESEEEKLRKELDSSRYQDM